MGSQLQQILSARRSRFGAPEFLGDDYSGGDYSDDPGQDDTGTFHDPNEWTKLISGSLKGVADVFAAKQRGSSYTSTSGGGGYGGGGGYSSVGGSQRINPPAGYAYDPAGRLIAQAGANAGAGIANVGTGLVNFVSNNTGLVVIVAIGALLWKSGRK